VLFSLFLVLIHFADGGGGTPTLDLTTSNGSTDQTQYMWKPPPPEVMAHWTRWLNQANFPENSRPPQFRNGTVQQPEQAEEEEEQEEEEQEGKADTNQSIVPVPVFKEKVGVKTVENIFYPIVVPVGDPATKILLVFRPLPNGMVMQVRCFPKYFTVAYQPEPIDINEVKRLFPLGDHVLPFNQYTFSWSFPYQSVDIEGRTQNWEVPEPDKSEERAYTTPNGNQVFVVSLSLVSTATTHKIFTFSKK